MRITFLLFLIVSVTFFGCSKNPNQQSTPKAISSDEGKQQVRAIDTITTDIGKRKEITYEDPNLGKGYYKIAVTCDTLKGGQVMLFVENIGEQEVYLPSLYFYFEGLSQKLIGQMGMNGLFTTPTFPTGSITLPIGKKGGYAINSPKGTKSILVKNDREVVLFKLRIR